MKKKTQDYLSNLIWYFTIFSILGMIVETLFCYATMKIVESRKGFLYGPFCPVYGVGAVFIIAALDRFKESKTKVFIYGVIAGGIVEYILSYGLEAVYGLRFWDYYYLPFNINGRICLLYSIFWGFLSLGMIYLVKPNVDKLINKIPKKNIIALILFIVLFIDALITFTAISIYQERARRVYYNEEPLNEPSLTQQLFSNEHMLKTFPNIRLNTREGEIIFIKDILK